ncbi:unnamed protein product [Arabidopsis thaliana]|nr:unnamed protein product [Arabidopsis thaliana]
MSGCKKLKNISPNIFRLTWLMKVDFTDCGGVITTLSDSNVVGTLKDYYEDIEKRVVEPQTDSYGSVYIYFQYKGERYIHTIATDMTLMCKTDHLVLCSFKFRQYKNTLYPKVKDLDDVKFKFKGRRVKGCGVRLLHVSPYPDDSDGSSKAEYNQQSGEKCDAVETESSKKRRRMSLGNSEEDFNLPCGQTVTDTGLTAPNQGASIRAGRIFINFISMSGG